tara:strand:- start:137 stop:337 length:201 start_codon:yes stop_codon:yes gene_type:complete
VVEPLKLDNKVVPHQVLLDLEVMVQRLQLMQLQLREQVVAEVVEIMVKQVEEVVDLVVAELVVIFH